jgi:phage terminase small subunit
MEVLELNIKQKIFADEIVNGKSQREAYLTAGYKGKNDNVIDSKASDLVRNRKIAEYVRLQREKLEKNIQKKYDLTQDNIVKGYQKIIDGLQSVIDGEDTVKRTKVAAYKAMKDARTV